jgi:enolase
MMNFFNGGAHADNALDFQEFILVPHGARSFEQAMEWASEVYLSLRQRFKASSLRVVKNVSLQSFGVGDEGGFSIQTPPGMRPRDTLRFALRMLTEVVEKANHSIGKDGDFAIALDPAASEFFVDGCYVLGRRQKEGKAERLQPEELLEFYEELVDAYPIISIEDGMAENDEDGWRLLTKRLGHKCQLVGDDVFVTNPVLLMDGIRKGIANSVLIKVNQIGTLTEALDVVKIAQKEGYRSIVSHRSGETEDTTISDIAVAVNAGQIKTGCLSRADRVAKYNRLLHISQELGDSACFDGHIANPSRRLRRVA